MVSYRFLLSKLLHVSPARRMTAPLASEHPFLGAPGRAPPRRRLARAEVAANVAERAARVAERHNARIQRQQQQTQRGAAEEAEDNPLSDIAQLCAVMAAEARSLVGDVKRWDKAAAAAVAAAEEEEKRSGGGGGATGAFGEAASKAESAVQAAELLAREAGAGSAAAKAAADAQEHGRA